MSIQSKNRLSLWLLGFYMLLNSLKCFPQEIISIELPVSSDSSVENELSISLLEKYQSEHVLETLPFSPEQAMRERPTQTQLDTTEISSQEKTKLSLFQRQLLWEALRIISR